MKNFTIMRKNLRLGAVWQNEQACSEAFVAEVDGAISINGWDADGRMLRVTIDPALIDQLAMLKWKNGT